MSAKDYTFIGLMEFYTTSIECKYFYFTLLLCQLSYKSMVSGRLMRQIVSKVICIGEKNKVSLSSKMNRKKGHDTKIVSYHNIFFSYNQATFQ